DIEAIEAVLFLPGDQRMAALRRHQRQDRIAVIVLIGEIHPGIDLAQHAARENTNDEMRRLRFAVRARRSTPPDGTETELAAPVASGAPETLEAGIRRTRIARMRIAALRIGLPDFQHRVGNRLAVAVADDTDDLDLLTRGIRRHQIVADRLLPAIGAVRVPVG